MSLPPIRIDIQSVADMHWWRAELAEVMRRALDAGETDAAGISHAFRVLGPEAQRLALEIAGLAEPAYPGFERAKRRVLANPEALAAYQRSERRRYLRLGDLDDDDLVRPTIVKIAGEDPWGRPEPFAGRWLVREPGLPNRYYTSHAEAIRYATRQETR